MTHIKPRTAVTNEIAVNRQQYQCLTANFYLSSDLTTIPNDSLVFFTSGGALWKPELIPLLSLKQLFAWIPKPENLSFSVAASYCHWWDLKVSNKLPQKISQQRKTQRKLQLLGPVSSSAISPSDDLAFQLFWFLPLAALGNDMVSA